jgi:LuxR family maltose regulon positive regulatory protein
MNEKAETRHTILIVDDHPVFREGLRRLLEKEKDLKVVGEAGDGLEAIERLRELSPDLLVMDIAMPNLDGIDATRQILSESPDTRVVALSVHSGKSFVRDMLQAGALGYILKESVPEEMVQGIRTVLSGDVYLSSAISSIVLSEYKKFLSTVRPEEDSSPEPILRTKLHTPPVSADIVPRPRLIELLEKGRQRPMALISAPAGYGKSVLASQWLEVCTCPGAWLSLDENDNDLRVFLTYLIESVQDAFPGVALKTRTLLKAASLPSLKVLAYNLLNDMEQVEEPFILVMDDYHRIREKAVHSLLIELLRYPSPMLHLVLLTRRDPPLPIGPLRAGGQLTEITIEHLRFTNSETAAFLARFLSASPDESTASVLNEKVEGWVTGLRLAALSMGQKGERDHILEGLGEGAYFVREYLMQEVLLKVPGNFARFLMETSILNRFCAPLCDAVQLPEERPVENEKNGQAFIEWLEKTHLFVVPLDETHTWFRYHHLFQQLLQDRLKRKCSPEEIKALHLRAGQWFESEGLITESIEHALAAGDDICAAQTLERHRDRELTVDRWYVVKRWLDMIPIQIRRRRPRLLLTEAWIRNLQHRPERIPELLEQAAFFLRGRPEDAKVSGEIGFFRGYTAYFEGSGERSLQYLKDSVSQLAGTNSPFLGEAELMLGLARSMVGQKDDAVRGLKARIKTVDPTEYYLRSRLIAGLSFIHQLWGDLPAATAEAKNLRRISLKYRLGLAEAWSYYFLGCSHLQVGQLEAASRHFAKAVKYRYVLEPRASLDAIAGYALTQQFMGLNDKAAESCTQLGNRLRP